MSLLDKSCISQDAEIGSRVTVGPFCVISADVVIEEGVELGSGVILYPGTRIGRGVKIQDHAVVGKRPLRAPTATLGAQTGSPITLVESEVVLGTGAVLYSGCSISAQAFIGDGASLRENCLIGAGTTIGRGVTLEFGVRVGNKCLIFTRTYLSEGTLVEDEVFVASCVCSAAAKVMTYRRNLQALVESPVIRRGARIGTGSVLHPRIEIGEEAVVAAGSVVFETVPPATLVLGNPARAIRRVAPAEFLPDSPLLAVTSRSERKEAGP